MVAIVVLIINLGANEMLHTRAVVGIRNKQGEYSGMVEYLPDIGDLVTIRNQDENGMIIDVRGFVEVVFEYEDYGYED